MSEAQIGESCSVSDWQELPLCEKGVKNAAAAQRRFQRLTSTEINDPIKSMLLHCCGVPCSAVHSQFHD